MNDFVEMVEDRLADFTRDRRVIALSCMGLVVGALSALMVAKRDGEWRSEGLMNARRLTVERQLFLDDIDVPPAEAQRQVADLAVSLKKSHP